MKKVFAILFLFLFTVGCESLNFKNYCTDSPIELSKRSQYIKDYSTGLCYFVVRSCSYGGYDSDSVTHVPCESIPAELLKTKK